ncbi:hypothetical protein CPC08DRAFT_704970 [Agrocybe pediades]|nr:hypothetical protein CPC08DRAFT_704970 [Agrocybe pediades]
MLPKSPDRIYQRGKKNVPLLPVEAPVVNPSIRAGPPPVPNIPAQDQARSTSPDVEEEYDDDGTIKAFLRSIAEWLYRTFVLELFVERWYVGEEPPDDFQESYVRFFFALIVMLGRPGAWNYFFGKFFYDLEVSNEELRKGAVEAFSRPFDPILNPTYERHFRTAQLALWMKHIKKVEEHCKVVSSMGGIIVAVMAGLLQQQSSKIYSDTLWYLIVLTFMLVGFSLVVSYELFMNFVEVNGDPHNIFMWHALFSFRDIPGSIWNEWTMLALPSTYLLWSMITGLVAVFQMLRTPGTDPEPTSGSKETFLRILIGIVLVSGLGAWYGTRHAMDYYADRTWFNNFAEQRKEAEEKERQQKEQETEAMTFNQPAVADDEDENGSATETTATSNGEAAHDSTQPGEEGSDGPGSSATLTCQ